MKKRIISILLVIAMFSTGFTSFASDEQPELIKGFATAYNGPTDTTCTGEKVRKGICGGCEAYLGKTIILYQRLPNDEIGQIIGIYECLDTGTGTEGFQQGRVIDVWCPEDELQDFMNRVYEDDCHGKVWIEVLDAEG